MFNSIGIDVVSV